MFRHIRANIPNAITCLNMLCGAIACIMAFSYEQPVGALQGYQWAFVFICASAVFDFLDGAMARLLHVYSLVGKELDSLSDLVSFGLAPAMLMYNTIAAYDPGSPLAYAALVIAVCGGVRLARFNVDDRQTTSFIGLPIPANALLWIGAVAWVHTYSYVGTVALTVIMVLGSLLMVCPLPMFSLKFTNFGWRDNYMRYLLLGASLVFVVCQGFAGFVWAILLYLVMSVVQSRRGRAA